MADQDRSAALIQIGLCERERLVDPQTGAPQHDDQPVDAIAVAGVAGVTHDRDDLIDGRRVSRVALTLVSRTPRAAIGRVTRSGRSVAVTVDLPGLPGSATVQLYVTVVRSRHKLAQRTATLVPANNASRREVRFALPSTPPHGARIVVVALTQSGGDSPQLATTEHAIQVS